MAWPYTPEEVAAMQRSYDIHVHVDGSASRLPLTVTIAGLGKRAFGYGDDWLAWIKEVVRLPLGPGPIR